MSPRRSDVTIVLQNCFTKQTGVREFKRIQLAGEDFYEGEVLDEQLNGKGKVSVISKGMEYQGDWFNNQRHGQGVETWSDGRVYSGDFTQDQKEGYGELTLPDGTTYSGSFKKGAFDGFGSLNKSKAYQYTGNFINGMRQGPGKMLYANGDYYDGLFFKGKHHGQGIFYCGITQVTYEGEWFNGQKHGIGYVSEEGFAKTKVLYQEGVQVSTLEQKS